MIENQKIPVDVIDEHRLNFRRRGLPDVDASKLTALCNCGWEKTIHNTGTTTRRLHAQHVVDVLGLSREWGNSDPSDDGSDEPGSWYSVGIHQDAEARARRDAAKVGGQVFSRYVSEWVASDV